VHDNLGTIVGAGVDSVTVPELPHLVRLAVAIRLVGLVEEFTPDRRHAMANRITDPDGSILSELSAEFAINVESSRPEFLTGVTLPAAARFDAADEGTYAVEYEFGDSVKTIPLHVVLGANA
jgi:hypothetical protein